MNEKELLEQTKSKIQKIVDTMVAGLVTMTREGIVESINPAGARMFGHKEQELVGKHIMCIVSFSTAFSPNNPQDQQLFMKKLLKSAYYKIAEVHARKKTGETFLIEVSLGDLETTGGPRLLANILDVSERQVERLSPEMMPTVVVLEANIDDLSPQILSYTMDRLLEAGALDVIAIPIVMKKGRSGHLLQTLCRPGSKSRLEKIILSETSTFGVRSYQAERLESNRSYQEVDIGDGTLIRVKLSINEHGEILHAQPEYEDCVAYAKANSIPLKDVMESALHKFRQAEKIFKDEKVR